MGSSSHRPDPAACRARAAPAVAFSQNGGAMKAIEDTRVWLERAVIGLNLCPFAKAVHVKEQIRWVESAAGDPEQLLGDLVRELQFLAAADPAKVETTLLIHPHVLT